MFFLITLFAKVSSISLKLLKLGHGYTWPGHFILKIFPNILVSLNNKYPKGLIFISGTNGKTTTTKLITHLLRKRGLRVTTNASGANMLNGVLSSFLLNTTFTGKISSDIGVFEVDEFNLSLLLKKVTPDVLVLLNLTRD